MSVVYALEDGPLTNIEYHLSPPESDRLRLVLNIGDGQGRQSAHTANLKYHLRQTESVRLRLVLKMFGWLVAARANLSHQPEPV